MFTPFTSPSDLDVYANRSCSVLVGGLILRNLDRSIDEDALSVFSTVATVVGHVVVDSNPYLMGLPFLVALRTAQSVTVTNNPNLIDARLPSLDVATQLAVVEYGNMRVCSNNRAGSSTVVLSLAPCATRTLVFYIELKCSDMLPAALSHFSSLLNVSSQKVRDCQIELSYFYCESCSIQQFAPW